MSESVITRPHVYRAGSNHALLLLHGTGADEHDLLPLGAAIDSNATLLSPRGLHLENGMNRFFERYPDGSFNEQSILQAVDELAEFIEAAKVEYDLSSHQFTAVGFSNGANTAAALMVLRPDLITRAVLFGSTRPFRELPTNPDLTGKRIWIANGDLDPYAPVSVTEQWVNQLRQLGAEVGWLRHGGGHSISPAHLQQICSELI